MVFASVDVDGGVNDTSAIAVPAFEFLNWAGTSAFLPGRSRFRRASQSQRSTMEIRRPGITDFCMSR